MLVAAGKKVLCCAVLLMVLVMGERMSEAKTNVWSSFTPSGYTSRSIISTDSKEFIYYGFEEGTPLAFDVNGPTKIKVFICLRYTEAMNREQSYELILYKDGHEELRSSATTISSDRLSYAVGENFFLGEIRRMEIDVAPGHHLYELRVPPGQVRKFEARIFKMKEKVDLTPFAYDQPLTLFYKDTEMTYYLLTPQSPVEVHVWGPTQLQVITRLDYDPTMMGRQVYTIDVLQDGDGLKSVHIESKRSSTVTYQGRQKVVAGQAKSFSVTVPQGLHRYEFRLPSSQASGVALRLRIPAKDFR